MKSITSVIIGTLCAHMITCASMMHAQENNDGFARGVVSTLINAERILMVASLLGVGYGWYEGYKRDRELRDTVQKIAEVIAVNDDFINDSQERYDMLNRMPLPERSIEANEELRKLGLQRITSAQCLVKYDAVLREQQAALDRLRNFGGSGAKKMLILAGGHVALSAGTLLFMVTMLDSPNGKS